jgi:cytochrome bd-I ubiquinol oxidase subunit X
MWYFAWILGLGLALAFGIINALWHEFSDAADENPTVDTEGYASSAPHRTFFG